MDPFGNDHDFINRLLFSTPENDSEIDLSPLVDVPLELDDLSGSWTPPTLTEYSSESFDLQNFAPPETGLQDMVTGHGYIPGLSTATSHDYSESPPPPPPAPVSDAALILSANQFPTEPEPAPVQDMGLSSPPPQPKRGRGRPRNSSPTKIIKKQSLKKHQMPPTTKKIRQAIAAHERRERAKELDKKLRADLAAKIEKIATLEKIIEEKNLEISGYKATLWIIQNAAGQNVVSIDATNFELLDIEPTLPTAMS